MGEPSYERLVRSDVPHDDRELAEVDRLAEELRHHLALETTRIDQAHVHGASSSAIQAIVSRLLKERLGFGEEVLLTPQDGLISRPRPDFYFAVSEGRGILAEVERGGTTTNNHDLKDLWKTHIAPDAQHLFLVVPNANWSEAGAARERPFLRVSHRLAAFFGDPRREIDVASVHIFGYGLSALPPPDDSHSSIGG